MNPETGRTPDQQIAFERTLIIDLEKAYYATKNWRDKDAREVYATRFADALIRIQSGDVNLIFKKDIDPAGTEHILIECPAVIPQRRTWIWNAYSTVADLEKWEPNIRDLLPPEGA